MDLHESDIRSNDELSNLMAKAMVSVVAAMALLVMATVLVFSAGGALV